MVPYTLKQIYTALCQSILTFCISSWGGSFKTYIKKVEVAQRAILKVSTFKRIYFPTDLLYQNCDVLTVRQLYILSIIVKQHAKLKFDHNQVKTRRIIIRNKEIQYRTKFIHRFFSFLSSYFWQTLFFSFNGPYLYNQINKDINIYKMNTRECKKATTNWLKKLNYEDTEKLLDIDE